MHPSVPSNPSSTAACVSTPGNNTPPAPQHPSVSTCQQQGRDISHTIVVEKNVVVIVLPAVHATRCCCCVWRAVARGAVAFIYLPVQQQPLCSRCSEQAGRVLVLDLSTVHTRQLLPCTFEFEFEFECITPSNVSLLQHAQVYTRVSECASASIDVSTTARLFG